jgi:tripartite-type tricarboxylate transporter receptor subunit TctC
VAVLSEKRDPMLPNVATALEQGFPDLAISAGCNLMLAPAKTPGPIVRKLEESLERALQDKMVREKLEKMELTVNFLSARNTQLFIESEVKKWSPVVKQANIVVK